MDKFYHEYLYICIKIYYWYLIVGPQLYKEIYCTYILSGISVYLKFIIITWIYWK